MSSRERTGSVIGAVRKCLPDHWLVFHTRELATAALDIFLARGFSNTRMGDVADRAGVGKGTLYLYFPTKQLLFAGIVQEIMGRTLASFNVTQPGAKESVRSFILRERCNRSSASWKRAGARM